MFIGKAAGPSPVFRSMIAKYKIIFDEMVNKNEASPPVEGRGFL